MSQGRQFSDATACPFCDQDISSNDLVLAYQTHFNEAYSDLKVKVAALSSMVATGTATNSIDFFAQHVGVAVAQASAWTDQVPTQSIKFDADVARASLAAFREFVADLAQRKSAAPTDPLGTEADKTKANTLWEQLLDPVRAANASIKAADELISAYKCQLVSDSVPVLQQQVQQLQAIKRRYDPKAIELFLQLNAARKIVETADKVKKAARDSLDGLMVTTLGKYQMSINALLQSFGASFSINGMSANFRGNAPRSEYGLLLRGKSVPLEGGPPSFATALSDGDKRTLAFAFFVASALEDPKLSTQTIVIDDPMCSLDLNRRHHTQTVLMQLHTKAAQLIVLAHDPYFLRDLRSKLLKQDKTALVAVFQLVAVQHNYTDFAEFDIDKECESLYFQHHRLLNNHVAGNGADPSAVAKSIRPMLEGYLRRRFPGLIPQGIMFGDIVLKIRDAVAPSPLCHAQNLIDELNNINGYAGQFHHDQSDTVKIAPGELMGFVNRALIVVHKSAPP